MGYEFLRHAQPSYLEMNLPTIQKVRKHLKWKAQQRAIKSINEVTTLDDEKDISDFLDSSNDDFQKFLPTNIRHCC